MQRYTLYSAPQLVRSLWRRHGGLWLGALAIGIAAALYAWLMTGANVWHDRIVGGDVRVMFLLAPAVGMMSVWITRRYFAGAEGSGMPQTLAALHGSETARRRLLTPRLMLAKVGVSALATMGGFPIGRQGPTVFIGAVVMYRLRRQPETDGGTEDTRDRCLIAAGAAAGLAAAFNTPLAGIAFAAEQLTRCFRSHDYSALLAAIFVACAIAALAGKSSLLTAVSVQASLQWLVCVALVAGFATGLVGSTFAWLLLHPERWMPRRLAQLRTRRPTAFGALSGLFIAALAFASGGTTTVAGDQAVQAVIHGDGVSIAYPLARMLALLVTCLAGIPGGIFVPSLSIGAGIGGALHYWISAVDTATLVSLAMAGYLAAVTRNPVTSFVIVMELAGSMELALPLMVASLVAYAISRLLAPPIYDTLALGYNAPR